METAKAWDCPRCDQVNEPTKPICDCGFNIKSVDQGTVAIMRKKRGNKLILSGLFSIVIGVGILIATVFGESHYFILPSGLIAAGCSMFALGFRAKSVS